MVRFKWPQRLVIVRHGQSEQNAALDLFQDGLPELLDRIKNTRDAEINLTKTGIFQAKQTGIYLAQGEPFDACFSSPYKRTLQTAKEIVSNLKYSLAIWKDNRLREKEFGLFHGLTTPEIKEKYPDEYKRRERDGRYWYRLPRGENYPDVEERVHSVLDKLNRDYGGMKVLVVTHQVPYILFRALFEHLDEAGVLGLGDVPNCGIQEYVLDTSERPEGRMQLTRFNEIAYNSVRLPID